MKLEFEFFLIYLRLKVCSLNGKPNPLLRKYIIAEAVLRQHHRNNNMAFYSYVYLANNYKLGSTILYFIYLALKN